MKRFVVIGLIAACVVALAPTAFAHPLGNFTVNTFSGIEIDGTKVTVDYAVDMAEIPTLQLKQDLDDASGSMAGAIESRFATELPAGVALEADGKEVELSLESIAARFRTGQGGLDILRIDVVLSGDLPSDRLDLDYRDTNFGERVGWREIVISAPGGRGIADSSVPSESISNGLRDYPTGLLSDAPRVTEASARLEPGAVSEVRADGSVPTPGSIDVLSERLASLIDGDYSIAFVLFALLMAAGAGALHAIGPGHGKTVMAAYLVGAGGRARQAVVVGMAVSLMHTFSVVVLGLVTLWASSTFAPESVYPWLSFASGVLVLGLGTWLLRTRIRARIHERREHGHRHSHPHSHDHDHATLPPDVALLSWRGLGAIAVSGGLLPSPAALIVLLGAVAIHRVAFGIALVAAFSVGLAAALTLVGLLVLKARDVVGRKGGRMTRVLPVLSAAAIALVGAVLTTQAVVNLPI